MLQSTTPGSEIRLKACYHKSTGPERQDRTDRMTAPVRVCGEPDGHQITDDTMTHDTGLGSLPYT